VADVDPFDGLAPAQRLGQAIQAIADNAEDTLDAGLGQRLGNEVGDIFDPHALVPFNPGKRMMFVVARRRK
jgi:hypothetical protein